MGIYQLRRVSREDGGLRRPLQNLKKGKIFSGGYRWKMKPQWRRKQSKKQNSPSMAGFSQSTVAEVKVWLRFEFLDLQEVGGEMKLGFVPWNLQNVG